MNDKEPSATESSKAVGGAPPIRVAQPQSSGPDQPASQDDLTAVKKQLANAEKEMSGFERSTLNWTRASFVVIFFTCLFIALQWYEMRSGGEDTHTLAEAAKRQADKSETISDSMAKAVIALDTSNKQAKEGLDKTLVAAQRSLDTSIRINREALAAVQRAFVSFSFHINPFIVLDAAHTDKIHEWQFMIPFQNSGATPTRGMHLHVNSYHDAKVLPDDFDYRDYGERSSQLIVLGQKEEHGSQLLTLGPEIIQAVRVHKEHLYFYGWAIYRDVFPWTPTRITEFCYEMTHIGWPADVEVPNAGQLSTFFSACPHHNCTDEECDNEKTSPEWAVAKAKRANWDTTEKCRVWP